MDLHGINLFLHLSETLHFGKTSRACYISTSALSRQIQRLEEEVGKDLFKRDNRSVELTAAGLVFKEYALEITTKWENLKISLRDEEPQLTGTLVMFCSVTASYTFMRTLLNKFRAIYPAVHLKLNTGAAENAIARTLEGQVDVAMSARPAKLPSGVIFSTCAVTSLVFIVEKNFAPVKEITSKTPMILPERGVARSKLNKWLKDHSIRPNIYAEVSGNEAILAMVSLGCGVGVVPYIVLENSPFRDHISILKIEPELGSYEVGWCTTKRKILSPVVTAFWEVVTLEKREHGE